MTCGFVNSDLFSSSMAVPRLVTRSLLQRRLPYALATRSITTPPPPPPPPPNPTNPNDPLTPKSLPSLDISPIQAPAPPNAPPPSEGRTGARSAKDSLSSIEKKRRAMARWTIALAVTGVFGSIAYMGRDWENEEERKAIGADVSEFNS